MQPKSTYIHISCHLTPGGPPGAGSISLQPPAPYVNVGGLACASVKSCEIKPAFCACASVKSCEIKTAFCARMGRKWAALK